MRGKRVVRERASTSSNTRMGGRRARQWEVRFGSTANTDKLIEDKTNSRSRAFV